MFWIGLLAGYFIGFVLSWILLNAIREWGRQDQIALIEGRAGLVRDGLE